MQYNLCVGGNLYIPLTFRLQGFRGFFLVFSKVPFSIFFCAGVNSTSFTFWAEISSLFFFRAVWLCSPFDWRIIDSFFFSWIFLIDFVLHRESSRSVLLVFSELCFFSCMLGFLYFLFLCTFENDRDLTGLWGFWLLQDWFSRILLFICTGYIGGRCDLMIWDPIE